MSNHGVQENGFNGGYTLAFLSDDFRRVVERIQTELNGVAIQAMDAKRLDTVDDAERIVDSLALALQQGVGNRNAWREALAGYESAWLEIIRDARDSDN